MSGRVKGKMGEIMAEHVAQEFRRHGPLADQTCCSDAI